MARRGVKSREEDTEGVDDGRNNTMKRGLGRTTIILGGEWPDWSPTRILWRSEKSGDRHGSQGQAGVEACGG